MGTPETQIFKKILAKHGYEVSNKEFLEVKNNITSLAICILEFEKGRNDKRLKIKKSKNEE